MGSVPDIVFKNLKANITNAIKESCYRFDARLYNIANHIPKIPIYSLEPDVESAEGLLKIIDKTIKDSVGIGCDLSVVVKGILLGSFRSSPFLVSGAQKTIGILIKELLLSIFRYKGDIKQATEGILAAIVIVSNEYKLNVNEILIVAREDILSSAKVIDPKFADDIKEVLPNPDDSS